MSASTESVPRSSNTVSLPKTLRLPANDTRSGLAADIRIALLTGCASLVTEVFAQRALMLPGLSSMALLWPPNVVLFAALTISPLRRWWMLVAASLAASLAGGAVYVEILRLLAMIAGNAVQATLAAAALRAFGCDARDLRSAKGITVFILLAACLSPLLASVFSAALLRAGGWIGDFNQNWTSRFVTNVASMLSLGPPFLLMAAGLERPPRRMWLEAALLILGVGLAEAAGNALVAPIGADAARYLPLPFLLWAAVRGGVSVVALVALTVTLIRFWLLSAAPQPAAPFESLLSMQLLVIAMTVPTMVLAVVIHRWRSVESELRSSHERHRLATAAGRVGAWELDPDSGTIALDSVLKNMLGYADREIPDVIDQWHAHIHPADRSLIAASVAAHIERGEPFEVEYRMIHKDQKARWFIARGGRVGARASPRIMGTCVDVTERRRMEDAVQTMKASLDRAARASNVGTAAAAIAHELSQPLFAITANTRASLQWLDSGSPALDQIKEALEDIASDSARANEAIQHMRDWFEPAPLARRRVSVERVVGTSLEIVRRQISAAEIVVHTDFPSGLPRVWGDPAQLRQVFDNLLSNAITALKAVTTLRHLWIRAEADSGDYVRIAIRDSGCGTDPQHLDRIFDPFFSTRADGLGLGLTVTRSIVAAHGGKIRASVNSGRGMLFEVWLQAATSGAPAAPNAPPPSSFAHRPRAPAPAEEPELP